MLSVPRFTDFYCPFGIFKHFLQIKMITREERAGLPWYPWVIDEELLYLLIRSHHDVCVNGVTNYSLDTEQTRNDDFHMN